MPPKKQPQETPEKTETEKSNLRISRCRTVKAVAFANDVEGVTRYSTKVSKEYFDKESEEWKEVDYLNERELDYAIIALTELKERINAVQFVEFQDDKTVITTKNMTGSVRRVIDKSPS